ncbi:alpha-amylase family glycosyl hydrolase [Massilia pseudoviolaceinigra]|uniref:alpha-amylase family glycosyl hydrolase n=1 Tax=Massilia pseudoviolaceinigra TaxID=3057165 RepID=UPI0027967656|nr:alpha-amylase family glycosyl hydrolase [Massilia sp. CCM 9206]MDQ1922708.1 alpha-amylase family glycosyl hydrolase [Massilia sp. CCM 9206]
MTTFSPQQRMLDALPLHLREQAAQRYARHAPVLLDRLQRLYGHRADFHAWYADLMGAVGALHGARSPELLALDARRAADPAWFAGQHMLGYSAYVQQFGGSLRGVIGRIAHLREMGVTYLHLLPFLRPRAGESDGGFAVASFDEVDPALGTGADLLALTAALRDAGISLCSDLVLNHVADDHAWALGAKEGDVALRDYFHVFPDREQPDRYEQTVGQIFPEAAPGNFTWVDAMQGWVWTTFYPFQWDLNYANPQVLSAMVQSLLRLANRGVEVFRLDSTAFLWKREGSDCMNQPEAHQLLQVLRAIVEIAAPGVLLKAEAIVPTRELPAYFGAAGGAARECHLAYHSTLMAAGWAALAEQDAGLLRAVAAATPALPPAASWLTYVRCHDDIGWNVLRAEAGAPRLAAIADFYRGGDSASFAAGVAFQTSAGRAVHGTNGSAAALAGLETAQGAEQEAYALRRLMLLHGLALAFGGLPMLYMGDELGMQNDHTYLGDAGRARDTRWVQRAPFDQLRYAQRHDRSSPAGRVFGTLCALLERRRGLPMLAAGAPRALLETPYPALLALTRGERFLSLSNFSAQPLSFSLSAIGAGQWPGAGDAIALAPWDMLWLERPA